MKFWLQPILIFTLILTGGCTISSPDTRAFQDDFTREFMDSPREVEEGYYLFRSKTDGYTMLFPKNYNVDKSYYYRQGDNEERLSIGNNSEEDNIIYNVTLIYENREITEHVDLSLNLLNDYLSYEGDYEGFEHNGKTFYYAKNEHDLGNEDIFYRFFSYVKSNENSQGIRIIYSVTCLDTEKPCQIETNKEEAYAQKLMKSIEFQ